MPGHDRAAAPPFDQGVFLLHYNRGREAFQEGRYAEARRELESAQKMRSEDADVLNLLGLVYFKTNSFPEAEVIYRRLVKENSGVFILHSNLGLILFKQGKLDESEYYLLKSVELRPNYAKSHLYLGLLYRQRGKFGLAMEHLKFAGADKLVREVELEMRPQKPAAPEVPVAPPVPPAPAPVLPMAAPAPAPPQLAPVAAAPVKITTQRVATMSLQEAERIRSEAMESRTQPGTVPTPQTPMAPPAHEPEPFAESASNAAARKLQDAVDETAHADERRLDLAHKIEGASRTFALHENGFLEINFNRSVHVKKGTVSSYSGNLKFVAESGLVGTTAQMLVKAVGQGKVFVYEKGRKTFLLDLNEEFIYVEGRNLLALEDTLTYRVEPIYDTSYQRKIDTVKIFGRGSLAISTSIEPLTLRVTREYPLLISSNALVAWTGSLIPTVVDDKSLDNLMIETDGDSGFKIRFEGDGIVVSES